MTRYFEDFVDWDRRVGEPINGSPAAFGDSFTWGVGVQADQTFSSKLGVLNCGERGAGNEKILRNAITYCENFYPRVIMVVWSFPIRYEWLDEDGEFHGWKHLYRDRDIVIMPHHKAFEALDNDNWREYLRQKNQLMLHSFCGANGIDLVQSSNESVNHHLMGDYGTDNEHPGVKWHNTMADILGSDSR